MTATTRITLDLDDERYTALRQTALAERRPASAILRDALDRYLREAHPELGRKDDDGG